MPTSKEEDAILVAGNRLAPPLILSIQQ